MHSEAVAQENRTASVTPTVRPSAPWRVQEVTALPDYRLSVRFVDGLAGTIDLSALIASPEAGVFARLRDLTLFNQVYVELGVRSRSETVSRLAEMSFRFGSRSDRRAR